MELTTRLRLVYTLPVLAFIVICVLYALEIQRFREILDLRPLVIGGLLVGAVVGTELGYRLTRAVVDRDDRLPIYAACLVTSLLLFPPLATFLNRALAAEPAARLRGEVFEQSTQQVYVFLPERGLLAVPLAPPPYFPKQTQVEIHIQRGLFGAEFVVHGSIRTVAGNPSAR